ncbi:MAG TPA: hypothetical protein ENK39_04615 [Epsilonproteobacteria bacterium]|nr:hypothetical protein [Campylobacterota bacterium]
MSEIEKKEIDVTGATVPFYEYTIGETQYYEFDTSKCGPPEPMVNAMSGLKLIKGPQQKVVMINHKKPMGLLEKIGENYDIKTEKMEDGRMKLIFSYKEGESEKADLSEASCAG